MDFFVRRRCRTLVFFLLFVFGSPSLAADKKPLDEKISDVVTDMVNLGIDKLERKLDSHKTKEAAHDVADAIAEGVRKVEEKLTGKETSKETGAGTTLFEADIAAEAINVFALDLHRELSRLDQGDLFFSPYSIVSALGMTYAGASGNTALEMEKALHLPGPELHASMRALISRLEGISTDLGILATANKLWLGEGERPRFPYLRLLQEDYRSDAGVLDFAKDPDGSRKTVNLWVEEKTNDRIKDLLQPGDVGRDTVLILTNAIYFNSLWSFPFEAQNTKPLRFRTAKDKTKELPTMYQQRNFLYNDSDGVQIVKLPYETPGISMLVLLPRVTEKFDQMQALEKKLWSNEGSRTLKTWIGGMKERKIDLWLPKFQQGQRFMLNEALKVLGMKDAFSANADFSGILETNKGRDAPIAISAVIHQTFVVVDEVKTEAAASTAVTIQRASLPIPEETTEFRADHPFLYLIMDDLTGTILFFGRQGFN